MNKNKSKSGFTDPLIVSRVQSYLAENVDKTYVDVSKMARCLKQRYAEYSNRNDSAFCKKVESAYKVVLDTYGVKGTSTSEGSDEEFEGGNGTMNKQLTTLNKPNNPNEQPIDVLSSDEEDVGPTIMKFPKLSDQITITPHVAKTNKAPAASAKRSKPNDSTVLDSPAKASSSSSSHPAPKPVVAKKKFDVLATKNVKVTLADIGGVSDILEQIADLVLHMKHPEVYGKLGIKYPRGALLHGPPGTGKTLLAYAIAGKLKLPLIAVSGTELVGGVSGESEERIRELFDRASSLVPSILFIDEIDAICSNRANAQKDMEKRMVAQLLASLDALGEKEVNVLVLAATNNPDTLDPALRRAGRLEQEIALGIPTLNARKEILSILCKGLCLNDDINLDTLAQITPGFVGADLQALVNKASTHAVKRAFMVINSETKPTTIPNNQETVTQVPANLEDENKNDSKIEEVSPLEAPVILDAKVSQDLSLPDDALSQEKLDMAAEETSNDFISETFDQMDESPITSTNFPAESITKTQELLNLLEDSTPYTAEQLSGISINQNDFLKALKTTKPCAVREGIVTVPDVTWNDVGSLEEVRKDLKLAVLAPVKYPELLQKLGLTVPSGVLLCGPPGCGKTLLAKAVANEAGVNFISVKGPELLNMYVGESERAVRTCFRRARNSAPCVIFFDEFDALCPRRAQHDNNGASRVVNQLLTEMDGIESREGVFVLAASNRPDIIDPAVLRPGRLERVIYVGMPNTQDRVDILFKLSKKGTQPQLHSDVNLEVLAEKTVGYTGADLAGLVRSAATIALSNYILVDPLRSSKLPAMVTFMDFMEALAKCRPSVSSQQLEHYEKLRLKYASEVNENKMEVVDTC